MKNVRCDLLIYGATSGGVASAVIAGRAGLTVILVEPGRHIGGMTSGGLGWTDHGRKETVRGFAREFYQAVGDHYEKLGDANKIKVSDGGWYFEPHVAEQVLTRQLADEGIEPWFEHRVSRVERDGDRIAAVVFDHAPPAEDGAPAAAPEQREALRVQARCVIDATYECDLTAMSGAACQTDRESRDAFGESNAGVCFETFQEWSGAMRPRDHVRGVPVHLDPYVTPGRPDSGLLPLISPEPMGELGAADSGLQAFNFRLCLVRDADDGVPLSVPEMYDPQRYELLGRLLVELDRAGVPLLGDDIVHLPGTKTDVLKLSVLPGSKCDLNNNGPFSTDLVSEPGFDSNAYVHGDWATRAASWRRHRDHMLGLLHFLATDPRADASLKAELSRWRLPADEFQDTGHWPHQLYVREARRLIGQAIVTEQDCVAGAGSALAEQAVVWGSYSLDSHICRRLVHEGQAELEGGFMRRVAGPYPLPYGSLIAGDGGPTNLWVTFGLSATHAAYSGLRMEPVFMMAGEAAAEAAVETVKRDCRAADVDVAKLRDRLASAKLD